MSNNSAILVPPPGSRSGGATALVTNDIHDIRPPVPIPNPWLWLWLGLGLLAVIAAGLGLWFFWRKKRVEAPPLPVVPPHVRAKHKLAGALSMLHDPRAFCSLVSDTLRLYLEERFSIKAPERTTEEFLIELNETTLLNLEQRARLAEFLEKCDMVKFAKFEPTETELRALLEAAMRLIDETQFEYIPMSGQSSAAIRPGIPPNVPTEVQVKHE
jgi:hypothetical protein